MLKKIEKFFKLRLSEIMLLVKDVIFTNEDENITRIIRFIKKLKAENRNASLILDIGAFDGMTSIRLSKAFPNYKTLAFEPNKMAFDLARKNCQAYKNIVLYNVALSDKSGEAELNVTENQVSSSLHQINREAIVSSQQHELSVVKKAKVGTQPLDELNIEEEILLLKIDVQGHEKEVLSGGRNTLKKVYCILVEMNNHNIYFGSSKYYEVDLWLRENNFELADIIVTSRKDGLFVTEYDAIYINRSRFPELCNK